MNLRGATVVLTGGSRGLGPVMARALLDRGARVALAARSRGDLEAVADGLPRAGAVIAVEADVTDVDDRERLVRETEAAFGPVDVLINNAGVERIRHFAERTQHDVLSTVRTNLEAAIALSLLVVPGMLERRRGHIVNMASVAGKTPVPYNVVYAATKHGLVGFSHSLRAELRGTGVGVSAICPGYVSETGMATRWTLADRRRSAGLNATPAKVAAAVVRSIERDLPEVVVSGILGRLADVSLAVSPRLTDAAARRTGAYDFLRMEADAKRGSLER